MWGDEALMKDLQMKPSLEVSFQGCRGRDINDTRAVRGISIAGGSRMLRAGEDTTERGGRPWRRLFFAQLLRHATRRPPT